MLCTCQHRVFVHGEHDVCGVVVREADRVEATSNGRLALQREGPARKLVTAAPPQQAGKGQPRRPPPSGRGSMGGAVAGHNQAGGRGQATGGGGGGRAAAVGAGRRDGAGMAAAQPGKSLAVDDAESRFVAELRQWAVERQRAAAASAAASAAGPQGALAAAAGTGGDGGGSFRLPELVSPLFV